MHQLRLLPRLHPLRIQRVQGIQVVRSDTAVTGTRRSAKLLLAKLLIGEGLLLLLRKAALLTATTSSGF